MWSWSWCIHRIATVNRRLLGVACLAIVAWRHIGVRLRLCSRVGLSLSRLGALLAKSFRLLLLVCPWCWRSIQGARLKVHRWHKWSSVLLLRNEWVQLRLLWRPPFEGVNAQQASNKIDKGNSVIHFYTCQLPEDITMFLIDNLPRSISLCFMFFLGMGYDFMISGSVLAWKYFLLGCSLVFRSRAYCSMLFKW